MSSNKQYLNYVNKFKSIPLRLYLNAKTQTNLTNDNFHSLITAITCLIRLFFLRQENTSFNMRRIWELIEES